MTALSLVRVKYAGVATCHHTTPATAPATAKYPSTQARSASAPPLRRAVAASCCWASAGQIDWSVTRSILRHRW